MLRTVSRRQSRQAEARAVRKAVSVLACRRPSGLPVLENSVMAPVGAMGLAASSSAPSRLSSLGGLSVMTGVAC